MSFPKMPLVEFLNHIEVANSAPVPPPSVLVRLARSLIGRRGSIEDAEDAAGDLVLRLVEATRRGTAGSVIRLHGLDEPQLRGVLRHRLAQVIAERSPNRRQCKQLRDAVRRALLVEVPVAPQTRPGSITVDGKISTGLVASALAWIAQEEGPSRDVRGLAARLQDLYEGCQTGPEAEVEHVVDAHETLEATRCAAELRHRLGPDLERVVARRMAGASLKEVATEEGAAVSTIFCKLQQAAGVTRSYFQKIRCSRSTGEMAMALLGT